MLERSSDVCLDVLRSRWPVYGPYGNGLCIYAVNELWPHAYTRAYTHAYTRACTNSVKSHRTVSPDVTAVLHHWPVTQTPDRSIIVVARLGWPQ